MVVIGEKFCNVLTVLSLAAVLNFLDRLAARISQAQGTTRRFNQP